jgi:hypothetical protein
VLPLNSVTESASSQSCSWKCKPNYFLTLPTNKTGGIPTCRKCSAPQNVLQQCKIGEKLQNCTNTLNTQCIPCDPEELNEKYFIPGDCVRKKCKSGYTYWAPENLCIPCPENFYCVEQEKSIFKSSPMPCPENCTTKKKKNIYSSLGCNYPSFSVGTYLLLNVKYITSYPQSLLSSQKIIPPKGKKCPSVDKNFIDILEFGNLEKCTVAETYISTIIEISCSIILSTCYNSNDYNEWLSNKLKSIETDSKLQQAIKFCIFNYNLNVYELFSKSVSVVRTSMTIVKTLNFSSTEVINLYQSNELFNNNIHNVQDIPNTQSSKLHWWKNKNNALNVVAFFFVILGFLFVSLFIMIFIYCSVYYKYKFLQRHIRS